MPIQRNSYSVTFKLRCIQEAEKSSQTKVANKYSLSRRCLSNWIGQKEYLLNSPRKSSRKRLQVNTTQHTSKGAKYPELEAKLFDWFVEQRERKKVGLLFIIYI